MLKAPSTLTSRKLPLVFAMTAGLLLAGCNDNNDNNTAINTPIASTPLLRQHHKIHQANQVRM